MTIDKVLLDHEDYIDEMLSKLEFLVTAAAEAKGDYVTGLNMMNDIISAAQEKQDAFWKTWKTRTGE